jgi:hypothetical protein
MNTYAAYNVRPFKSRTRRLKVKLNFKFSIYTMFLLIVLVILSEILAV